MTELFIVAFGAAFLFGLVQWARGGAILWDVIRFSRRRPQRSPKTDEEEGAAGEEKREEETLRELESMTDRLLRSSFRVLGILALCVWLFVIATIVSDILGLGWMDRLSFQTNRLWGDPTVRAGARSSQSGNRNSVLRSLGSGLRK